MARKERGEPLELRVDEVTRKRIERLFGELSIAEKRAEAKRSELALVLTEALVAVGVNPVDHLVDFKTGVVSPRAKPDGAP